MTRRPEDRLAYSAIIDRQPLTLPHDARLAVWVVGNVEHYEYLPPTNPLRDPWPTRPHPDTVNYGRRDWGNRVGVWRMLDLFDQLGIPATISLNAAVLDHYPAIADALAARPHDDVMAHGLYNTRYAASLDEAAERALIADVCRTVERIGKQVAGWLGPALTTTPATFDLLSEAGVRYVGDLLHDDEPTEVRVESGSLVALPYSIHLNDSPLIGRSQHSGRTFARLVREQFAELYRESEQRPKVLTVCLHPYAVDAPSRHRHFAEALAEVLAAPGVVAVTGDQLAEHYRAAQRRRDSA